MSEASTQHNRRYQWRLSQEVSSRRFERDVIWAKICQFDRRERRWITEDIPMSMACAVSRSDFRARYLVSLYLSIADIDHTPMDNLDTLIDEIITLIREIDRCRDTDGVPPNMEFAVEVWDEGDGLSFGGLETVVSSEGDEDRDCAICLQKVAVGVEASRTPCSHTFHMECIQSWFRKSYSCPLCRFRIPL